MKKIAICILGGSLTACSTMGPLVEAPLAPKPISDSTTIHIKPIVVPPNPDDVVSSDHVIDSNARKVVINMPADLVSSTAKRNEAAQIISKIDQTSFTFGFEQQIEKELVRKNFKLISRDRLEAKLREMRDMGQDDNYCTGGYHTSQCLNFMETVSPEIKVAVNNLQERFQEGEIEMEAFIYESKRLYEENSREITIAGKKRDENEMVDVSEVIRAAKDGNVGADYILQINHLSWDRPTTYDINLSAYPEARSFMQLYPDPQGYWRTNSIQTCNQERAYLNAKLVHVKSGEVVWLGEYYANESMLDLRSDPLKFVLSYERRVVNERDVNNWVAYQNSEAVRSKRKNTPSPPAWMYNSEPFGISVVSGNCKNSHSSEKLQKIRSELIKMAANQLIGTISLKSY